jgi:hypothetical protein
MGVIEDVKTSSVTEEQNPRPRERKTSEIQRDLLPSLKVVHGSEASWHDTFNIASVERK